MADIVSREQRVTANTKSWTQNQWLLKISRDNLLRELLGMESSLAYLSEYVASESQRKKAVFSGYMATIVA